MPAGWAAAAAAVVGAVASESSSRRAAKSQQRSTDAAINEQARQYDTARDDQYAYRKAGEWALGRLTGQSQIMQPRETEENFDAQAYLRAYPGVAADPYFRFHPYEHYLQAGPAENVEFKWTKAAQEQRDAANASKANGDVGLIDRATTREDVMQDPGYQFGLEQGQQALDRKIAAMGGRVSGASLKAAARYGTDYASTGYNAAYQRGQDRLNRLAALAGLGQTATQASAASGANSANAISNLVSSQGNANAAMNIAQGNIWGNAANQLGGYYMNQQRRQPAYQPMRNMTYDTGYYGVGGGGGYGAYGDSSGVYMTNEGGG
jgi:hypothetical protein